jgi:hypothetical protein
MSGTILSYERDRAGLEARQGGPELRAAKDKLAPSSYTNGDVLPDSSSTAIHRQMVI